MIDPDEVVNAINYPQALREALIHQRNTMVGNIEVENSKEYQCVCCNRRMRKTQPVNFDVADIGFLGAGYTLYFMFNRMCLTILVTLLIFVNINPYFYTLVTNFYYPIQYALKQYELLNIEVIFSIFTIVYYFDKKMVQTVIELDETHVDPEDYSVCVKNLPNQFSQNHKLDTALKQYFLTQYSQKVVVASICLCYNLVPLGRFLSRKKEQLNLIKKYQTEKQKRMKIINMLFNTNQLPYEGISEYHGVKRQNSTNIEMGNFQQYSKQKLASIDEFINFGYHNSNLMFIGQAILSFESVEMKTTVLNESKSAYFFGNKLQIQQVTNPRDIIWHNLHLEESDYKLRRIFSYVSCVALIFTTLSIRIFFAWIQLKTEGTRFESSLLKSSTSGIIILMNIVIQNFFLKHLSHYEGHRTKVKHLTMFATKCIALQLLTCLIVPYLAAYFIFQMKQQQTYLQKIDDIIFGNALVSLLLLAISQKTLLQYLKIKLFELGGWRFIPKKVLTVKELCQMYQFPQFEIEKRYSETVKNTFLTVCFYTMVPKALYYTIIHLFFIYYLDKYKLVRKRCVMVNINGDMNRTMMVILLLSIPLHIVAEMINRKQISYILMALLLFSVVNLIKFSRKKRCEKKKDIANSMSFWEANWKYFHTDYRRENPALVGVAQDQFEEKVKELNMEMNVSQGRLGIAQ